MITNSDVSRPALGTEQQLLEAVAKARVGGLSWRKIGVLLGTSAQAAQQRYGAVLETT